MINQWSKGLNTKSSFPTASACAMALILSSSVMAASHKAEGEQEGQHGAVGATQQGAGPMVMIADKGELSGGYRASEWIGRTVKNRQGDELGKVEEVVIAPSGRVHYVAISASDVSGIGEDELAVVPWRAIEPAAQQEHLTVNLERERLAEAPRFRRGQWPDMADPEWNALVVTFYELEPAQPSFADLDVNENGKISKEEAQGTALSGNFEQLDIDQDGKINRTEFSAFEERIAEQGQRQAQQEGQGSQESGQFNPLPKQEHIGVPGKEDR